MRPQLFDVPADPIETNGKVIGWKWERRPLKVELGEFDGRWEGFVFVETRADWIFTATGDAWQFVRPELEAFLLDLGNATRALQRPLEPPGGAR